VDSKIEDLRDVVRGHEATYGTVPLAAYALVDTYTRLSSAPPFGEVRRALRDGAPVTLPNETDEAGGSYYTMTLADAVFELFSDQLGDILLEHVEQLASLHDASPGTTPTVGGRTGD
jgi:hypothetical protein